MNTCARRFVVVILGLGCGPSGDDESGSAAGTGSSVGSESTAPADDDGVDDAPPLTAGDDGSGSGSTGADGTSGDGSSDTGASACDPAYDDPGGTAIEIHIVNEGDVPLFVGIPASCVAEPFMLQEVATGELVQWHAGGCTNSCEDVLVQGCFDCGGCVANIVLRVDPGATHVVPWDGGAYGMIDFPAGCLDAPCLEQCERRSEAAAGMYAIDAPAGTECPGDPAACECPGGEPSCELYPTEPAMPTMGTVVQFDHPRRDPVIVAFQ